MSGLVKKGNPSKRAKRRVPRYVRAGSPVFPQQLSKVELLWIRYRGCCALCGRKVQRRAYPAVDAATVDHILPKSRGGTGELENLQLACFACNSEKAAFTMPEFVKRWCARVLQEPYDDYARGLRYSE